MTTSRSTDLLDGAVGLAARGVPVIPLRPRSKVPIHRNWPALGMLDPDAIRLEWNLTPEANVGVLCGVDALDGRGLIVLDVDQPNGPETLRRLELEHGVLPATVTVRTPGGGRHFYFVGHAVSWDPAPGLEVRSGGRQCAAPPSLLCAGAYRWVAECDLAEVPAWLQVPIVSTPRARGTFSPVGDRDPVLDVDPPMYFEALTGLTPNRHGFVLCPIHQEVEPSCKVYETSERGWFCFGCRRGGDVVSLAAQLAGIPSPVRGRAFTALLDYLAGRLL
jgi:Bifunctional DNA primase/polymerase, N-terminal/CHC2 zinc finger